MEQVNPIGQGCPIEEGSPTEQTDPCENTCPDGCPPGDDPPDGPPNAWQIHRPPLKIIEIPRCEDSVRVSNNYDQSRTRPSDIEEWCLRRKFMRYIVAYKSDALFRCVAKGMTLTNINFDHVKTRVINHLKLHRQKYEKRVNLMYAHEQSKSPTWQLSKRLDELAPYYKELVGSTPDPWNIYICRLKNTPNGGSLLDVEIIAKLFRCKISVYRDLVCAPLVFGTNYAVPPKYEVSLLSLFGASHYDLLIPGDKIQFFLGVVQSHIYGVLYEQSLGIVGAVEDSMVMQEQRRGGPSNRWLLRLLRGENRNLLPSSNLPPSVQGCLDPFQVRNTFFCPMRDERQRNERSNPGRSRGWVWRWGRDCDRGRGRGHDRGRGRGGIGSGRGRYYRYMVDTNEMPPNYSYPEGHFVTDYHLSPPPSRNLMPEEGYSFKEFMELVGKREENEAEVVLKSSSECPEPPSSIPDLGSDA